MKQQNVCGSSWVTGSCFMERNTAVEFFSNVFFGTLSYTSQVLFPDLNKGWVNESCSSIFNSKQTCRGAHFTHVVLHQHAVTWLSEVHYWPVHESASLQPVFHRMQQPLSRISWWLCWEVDLHPSTWGSIKQQNPDHEKSPQGCQHTTAFTYMTAAKPGHALTIWWTEY